MKKKIASLGEILRKLTEGGELTLDPIIPAVLECWPQSIPDALRPHVCLEGIRDGVLVVLVSHPVAGQQLQFLKEQIRHQINQRVGCPAVRDLRIKAGPLPPDGGGSKPESAPAAAKARALTRKEKGTITRLTRDIRDAEVREGLRSLMQKSLGLSRSESAGPRGNKRRAARRPAGEEG